MTGQGLMQKLVVMVFCGTTICAVALYAGLIFGLKTGVPFALDGVPFALERVPLLTTSYLGFRVCTGKGNVADVVQSASLSKSKSRGKGKDKLRQIVLYRQCNRLCEPLQVVALETRVC